MQENQLTLPLNDAGAQVPPAVIRPIDGSVQSEDRDRLTGQNLKVFERLQKGPVANTELSNRCLKYTSRISDIRKWLKRTRSEWRGAMIECERLGGGLNKYSLLKPQGNVHGTT